MAESEDSKLWFITHEGEQSGPYSLEELKAKVVQHELNPRLDMAWKEGLDDWILAGEIEGLFEKNAKAESAEKRQAAKSTTVREYEDQEWDGVSRLGFIFFFCIFPAIWLVAIYFGSKMLKDFVPEDILPIILMCLVSLPIFTGIFAVLRRFQNLAMSRLWFFGLFVPLITFWLGYRLFACPPGYAEHKRIGVLGCFLALIYWVLTLAPMGVGGMYFIKGSEPFKEIIGKNRAQYEEIILKAQEMTETPAEAEAREAEKKAKEKAEKGPSITPIW